MAKRKTTEWGIEFSVSVNQNGYEWREPMPHSGRKGDQWVLAPSGQIREVEPGSKVVGGASVRKIERGRGVVRRAYGAFRVLARLLTVAERREERIEDPAGSVVIWNPLTPLVSEEERRKAVVKFANKYGPLWGDNGEQALSDWTKEAAAFLDLDEVANALRTLKFETFDQRTICRDDGFGVRYMSSRYASEMMTIARPGEAIEERAALNALSKTTDFFERAKYGNSYQRAHMLLARQMNSRLAGGLSFQASLISQKPPTVTPRHLIHALYIRMWLDTLNQDQGDRERTCANPECNRTFTGTARKKYCSNECRWEYNNRRRGVPRRGSRPRGG